MKQYVYDVQKLKPGDILLERYDDRLSKFIMRASESNYSHAILYAGNGSCLEATIEMVIASNISRTLFDDPTKVCVLRLNDDIVTPDIIDKAIEFARVVYGTEYTKKDARAVFTGVKNKDENRQTCTRMVAQAFACAGVKLVEDPDFCSTRDIEMSPCLHKLENIVREATPEDIEFSKTPDVTLEMSSATYNMLCALREKTHTDIQSMEQVLDFVIKNPNHDEEISKIVSASGYLDVWKYEKDINPWSYDIGLFYEKFKDYTFIAAQSHFKDYQDIWIRFQKEYQKFKNMPPELKKLRFISQQEDLYKQLLNNTCQKMMVVIQILQNEGME